MCRPGRGAWGRTYVARDRRCTMRQHQRRFTVYRSGGRSYVRVRSSEPPRRSENTARPQGAARRRGSRRAPERSPDSPRLRPRGQREFEGRGRHRRGGGSARRPHARVAGQVGPVRGEANGEGGTRPIVEGVAARRGEAREGRMETAGRFVPPRSARGWGRGGGSPALGRGRRQGRLGHTPGTIRQGSERGWPALCTKEL